MSIAWNSLATSDEMVALGELPAMPVPPPLYESRESEQYAIWMSYMTLLPLKGAVGKNQGLKHFQRFYANFMLCHDIFAYSDREALNQHNLLQVGCGIEHLFQVVLHGGNCASQHSCSGVPLSNSQALCIEPFGGREVKS